MSGFMKVAVIIAATGLVTTLVLPGRKTPEVINAGFNGISKWTKVAQGRG
jgi:hypothetical protein